MKVLSARLEADDDSGELIKFCSAVIKFGVSVTDMLVEGQPTHLIIFNHLVN